MSARQSLTLLLAALSASAALFSANLSADEVNIYSARKEALIKPILDTFTQETGIKVNLVTGKADALLARLKNEGKLSPADMLLTTDAGRLHRAKAFGMFQPIESATLTKNIPANLRDTDNTWFGLSTRARPIMYAKDRVDPVHLSSYEALTGAAFKGKICIRSSSNIYNQSLIASMIAADGEKATQDFASGLVKNFARPPKGGDRDQIKAVANGECDIAIANTYYLAGMLKGKDAAQKKAAESVAVFWPNQAGRGTHINVSGAGILSSAKNKAAAIKLLEFLSSSKAQAWYTEANNEWPIDKNVASSALLKSFGEFKADTVNLSQLGELNATAVKVMDQAGWR